MRLSFMNPNFEPLVAAFESLAKKIEALTTEKRSVMEVLPAWNSPAIDKMNLALMTRNLKLLVRERAPDEFLEIDQSLVEILLPRLKSLEAHTISQFFSGNGGAAISTLLTSFQGIQAWLESTWPIRETVEPNSMPFKLARLARAAKARLDETVVNVDEIKAQIAVITAAHQAAEQLPADLEELKAARIRVGATNEQAITDGHKITVKLEEISKLLDLARDASAEADGYAIKSSEAYRFTTSHGLAASFDGRAKSLASSMWVWVGGLFAALLGVAFIGHNRVAALTAIVSVAEPHWGTVAINLVLSVVSVGAPMWFAWVATKQIGQRFRLSEDYGFKASVAKAYEGYRREAISIDKAFEAQLFGIALDRLREAPLRLVEEHSHGSPWHELFESPAFTEARRSIPDLAQRLVEHVKSLSKTSVGDATVSPKAAGVE